MSISLGIATLRTKSLVSRTAPVETETPNAAATRLGRPSSTSLPATPRLPQAAATKLT